MKMHQIIYVILIACFPLTASAWDIAVAVGNRIHFLNSTGYVMGNISEEEMKQMRALAYDSELHNIYFSDINQSNFSVLRLSVPQPVAKSYNQQVIIHPLVTKTENSKVLGVAYDSLTSILYWTTGDGCTIEWIKVGESEEPQSGQVLHKFDQEIPLGIAIDICRRFLYWTNSNHLNASIERSSLDGSNREVLIRGDLFQPVGIVVDQSSRRIYWVDEREDVDFRVESADLNGKNRKLITSGGHQQPFALAISGNNLFWTDRTNKAVWQYPLDADKDTKPMKIIDYIGRVPTGIVSSSQHIADKSECSPAVDISKIKPDIASYTTVKAEEVNQTDSVYCLNRGIEKNSRDCKCLPGYSGKRCEISVCNNYCVQGSCFIDTLGNSKCRCEQGWIGERCEVHVCEKYCLHGGRCYTLSDSTPKCDCDRRYEGDRCEQSIGNVEELCASYCRHYGINSGTGAIVLSQLTQLCRCPNWQEESLSNDSVVIGQLREECIWRQLIDAVTVVLGFICFGLVVTVAVLIKKVCILRKRPRIKKRIIVNKSVTPLTCRPQPDQCEITIENCCNMNICETPCFEPEFRTPHATLHTSKDGKEEKKNLLTSIELPPDDLY